LCSEGCDKLNWIGVGVVGFGVLGEVGEVGKKCRLADVPFEGKGDGNF